MGNPRVSERYNGEQMVGSALTREVRVTECRIRTVSLLLLGVMNEVRPNLFCRRRAVSGVRLSEDGEGPTGTHPVWFGVRDRELLMRCNGAGGDHEDLSIFDHETAVG